ncbi:MAG TPA: hypothetical protein VFX11_09435 [Candidatus Kapabacteria bacterium]|nr:hypothetical protein [Candidatus Kapabacteria bacterium]
MTDRELLELAALAAGIVGTYDCGVIWYKNPFGDDAGFNPLNNDGDAFRLAVKLRIGVGDRETTVTAFHRQGSTSAIHIEEIGDPYAATRRAILRAAAEIGKQIKEGGE